MAELNYRLFYVDDVDFSDAVNTRDYKVNWEDEVETWTDANRKTHGTVIRKRISGTLQLLFTSHTQYNYFVDCMTAAKTPEGKYYIGVHVNNEATSTMIHKFYAFVDFSTKVVYATKAFHRLPVVAQVDLKIEEE